jgi:signal transduction histidine kinase
MFASRPYEGDVGDARTRGVPTDSTFDPRPAGPAVPARRRGASRTVGVAVLELAGAGLLLGFVELAIVLSEPSWGPPWTVALSTVVAWIYLAAGVVAWLRRPSNRMGALMIAGAFAWLAAGFAGMTISPLTATGLITATVPFAVMVHLSVIVVTAIILARRWLRAPPSQRSMLAPLFAYGVLAVLFVPVSAQVARSFFDGGGIWLDVAQLGVLAGVPIAFVVAMLRGSFARTGELEELGAWLRADRAQPALADALALHNEQLTAELRAGHDQLQRSLARTVEASDVERRRIARDLHDGLQGRLVLLAIQANLLRGDPTLSADARASAAELGAGLQTAITELRDLVQGVMPAMLTERGLCAAAEELADRCPIPVALDLDSARVALPGSVESTGYFIVAEALANAVKHSHAAAVDLRMTRQAGRLRIELRDDGVGGAHANGGAGMRGMADRVAALGGRLMVRSPPGGGTGIVAELPCAS